MALVIFVLALIGWRTHWWWLRDIDDGTAGALASYGRTRPGWVRLNEVISALAGPVAFRIVGLVLLVLAIARRRVRAAVFLVLGIGLGGVVAEAIKLVTDRPRPSGQLVTAFSSSFPSSHAFGVATGVISLVLLGWPLLRSVWRAAASAGAVLLALLVGFSRVALVVHYVSDVVAGWALGTAWVLAWFIALRPNREPPLGADDGTPPEDGGAHQVARRTGR